MWEEQPEHQKFQVKLLGVGLVVFFIGGVDYCASVGDYELMGKVLLQVAANLACLGMLSGAVWLLVKFQAEVAEMMWHSPNGALATVARRGNQAF